MTATAIEVKLSNAQARDILNDEDSQVHNDIINDLSAKAVNIRPASSWPDVEFKIDNKIRFILTMKQALDGELYTKLQQYI